MSLTPIESVSLIPADNGFAIGAVLLGLAFMGFWLDSHPIGRKTSGMVWILIVAMLLSNFGITPLEAPAYGFVGQYMVSLAIPMLLLKANIGLILRESGKLLIVFTLATIATVAGAIIGFFLLDLGEIGPKVAGVYTGGWVGGAVNFLAVSEVVEMTDSEFTSAISASSVVSITALMVLIALPSIKWVTRHIPTKFEDSMSEEEKRRLRDEARPHVRLKHLTGVLALSFLICAVANALAEFIKLPHFAILFVTILTIIIANLLAPLMKKIEGDFEMGMIFMYIFFAMVGSATDATEFLDSAVILLVYGMLIIGIHILVVLLVARVLKIDLAEAIVASGAALVGPAATAAIAISRGWRSLITPGIMCGIFGYVIGTFIGVAVTKLLI
ncbi:MAG: DUF819 family protein [Pseudomonadota bacterium]